jgi:NADPH-dependent curcumin reductase CurA
LPGRFAKIKGCRVVGIAGGPEKCAWLTEEAGFDHAIDYKLGNLDQQIAEACPEKWNVFFDNVGGDTLEAALNHLNMRSRVVMCGGIANYNATTPQPGPTNIMNLVIMRSRMEGFIVLDYLPRAGEAIKDLLGWIGEGKLKYQVDMQEGFENIPTTLAALVHGQKPRQAVAQGRRSRISPRL